MIPPFQVIRREEMGDLEAEMTEIVETEERVVALNSTEAKTTNIKLLHNQVVVVAGTNTVHKEGAATGNANATEGAPQGGNREHNRGRAPAASIPNPAKLWEASVCSTVGN